MQDYLATLGLTPPSVDTEIKLAEETAQAEADAWIVKLNGMPGVPEPLVSALEALLKEQGPGSLAEAQRLLDAFIGQDIDPVTVGIQFAYVDNRDSEQARKFLNDRGVGPNTRSGSSPGVQGVAMYGPTPESAAGVGARGATDATVTVALRPRTFGRGALGSMIPEPAKGQPVYVENRVFLGDQEVKQLVRQEARVMERDRSLAYIGAGR